MITAALGPRLMAALCAASFVLVVEPLIVAAVSSNPAEHRVIGSTSSGTVVGKSYEPAHEELLAVGKQAVAEQVPECWRLDVVQYRIFSGGACVDKATWVRAKIGDRLVTGQINP